MIEGSGNAADLAERFENALYNIARCWRHAVDRRLKALGVSMASWMAIAAASLEFEHLHIPYVGQRTKFVLNGVGHDLIDAHDGNGVLLGGLTSQVESRDIDVGFRQYGA